MFQNKVIDTLLKCFVKYAKYTKNIRILLIQLIIFVSGDAGPGS